VTVVQELLKDPRVNSTLGDHGRTPLWWASYKEKHTSGRDLGDVKKGKWSDDQGYTALEIAREEHD